MRPEMRYIAIGAGIGSLLLALAAGIFFIRWGASPSAPSAPESTATRTPVLAGGVPLPGTPPAGTLRRAAPPAFPTVAPDILASLLAEGAITFQGPLSEAQQLQLYEAAIRYRAPTSEASREIGERINGPGYGSPDLICGPLALAILQDVGLVTYELIPHDFWLLNPFDVSGQRLVAQAFPEHAFERTANPTRLDQVDWAADPLVPGDFLYLKAGTGGNFDHMLTVSRVDSAGRAYAVTNYGTQAGYIIAEVILYDPAAPESGMFYTWTEKENKQLGSTGFGGFVRWRLRSNH